jgi:acetylornithine deacetylase/succinyl-diaminopimelate desuccinylase-like protein
MREVVDRFSTDAAAYLILEGMALGYIYHKGLPVRRFRVSAKTAGGHAWIHDDRLSALHTLILIASDLIDLTLPATPKTILNIGRMQGGLSINSIASYAEFEIEMRSESKDLLGDFAGLIQRKIEEYSTNEVQVQIEAAGERPAGSLPANHPLVTSAIFALKGAGFHNPVLECGSTDANLPLSDNLPAICVGITSGGDAHTTDEYIEIEPIRTGIVALLNLIEMIANERWIARN